MIPILYEADATSFITNGIARLRDAASVLVTEEKNGVYELTMTYPVDGAHFEDIIPGRIIAVTHDDSGDIQPFDIVSYSKPIDGMATFHAVHISYRQSFLTVTGQNINSLADALDLLATAEPTNPFTYQTDISSNAYLAAADGKPKSVRQLLGGSAGSILDAYGGEYEFDKFTVRLWKNRGQNRDFAVRYGINMTSYQDDTDYLGAFTSCIPFWAGGDAVVIGNKVDSGLTSYNGRDLCVPLDLTDKFETEPSTADLEAEALAYMTSNQSNLPQQNIKIDFLRLQDFSGYEDFQNLMACNLCDTISVVFPKYAMTGTYQIVRTVWNVLENRYQEMELGALQTTLAEALGVSSSAGIIGGGSGGETAADYVSDEGQQTTSTGVWTWREWISGKVEIWYNGTLTLSNTDAATSGLNRRSEWVTLPNNYAFTSLTAIVHGFYSGEWYGCGGTRNANDGGTAPFTKIQVMAYRISAAPVSSAQNVNIYVCGQIWRGRS